MEKMPFPNEFMGRENGYCTGGSACPDCHLTLVLSPSFFVLSVGDPFFYESRVRDEVHEQILGIPRNTYSLLRTKH